MVTDITKVNENWVYQSNKLIEASYSFTVLEQKLIRLLASMIKKDDEDFKEYQFKATDLCQILNIHPKNIYSELDRITDKLMERNIKVKSDNKETFKKRHLIKKADFENGILVMQIDEEMKDFYLKLSWYTKYQIKNIMQFKSAYSFRLYELLKQYEKIGYRTISIETLRIILDIEIGQYPKFANLNQKVIKVAVQEINTYTDLKIEAEPVKTNRKVIDIIFYISANKKNIYKEENTAQEEVAADNGENNSKEEKPENIDSEINNKIKSIMDIMAEDEIKPLEAKKIYDAAKGDLDIINQKYEQSKIVPEIKNIVGWLLDAIKKDYQPPKRRVKKTIYNNHKQKQYDINDIEKKLLGWDKD